MSAPVADLGLLGQLAEGDEGDERLVAGEPGRERPGELVAVRQGRDVGIEDDRVRWYSGQVAVTFGVGEGEEVVQFLIGLERVGRQILQGPDRPGALGRQQLRDGRAGRTGLPACSRSAPDDLPMPSAVQFRRLGRRESHCQFGLRWPAGQAPCLRAVRERWAVSS